MNRMIMWRKGYKQGMTEWLKNEGDFRIKGLASAQKSPSSHPHSVIPTHSWMTKLIGMERKWMGCLMNDIPPFFIFIPWHSRMTSKWRNEEEWGWFWKWAKKLNSEMSLILLSFCHSVIVPTPSCSFLSHLAIPVSVKQQQICNPHGMRSEWGMILKWMEWSCEEEDIDKEWPNDGRMREISELRVWP